MSKKEFLKKFSKALKSLPADERKRSLDYYSELIDDSVEAGATEEAAVCSMGDVNSISQGILSDAVERGIRLKKRSPAGVVLIILLIGFLVGVLLYFGTTAIHSIMLASGSGGEWTSFEEEYELGSKKTIDVSIEIGDLFISRSDDSMIHLTYYVNDKLNEAHVEETPDGLRFIEKNKSSLFGWTFGMLPDRLKRTTTLLLPEGFSGTITTNTITGNAQIDGVRAVSSVDMTATTGMMTVYNVQAELGSFKVTTGSLTVDGCSFGKALSKATTGDVDIKNSAADQLEVKNTTGKIILRRLELSTLEAGLTTGEISLDAVDAGNITLSATTGDLTGTLVGNINDYTIESSVTTGSSNLPGSFGSGERKLKAKTTTGDINIDFLNND